jgi:adenine-specific DNA methylase
MTQDQRLTEDYLPIEAISAEAKLEKSIRKGHISTFLHLWWEGRPLLACQAAICGALAPAPTTHHARHRPKWLYPALGLSRRLRPLPQYSALPFPIPGSC